MNLLKNESVWMGAIISAGVALLFSLAIIFLHPPTNLQSILGIVVCCGVPFIGAFVTIWHYTTTQQTSINAGQGAGLGAMALALGALVSGAISWVLQLLHITPSQDELWAMQKAQLMETYRQQGMSEDQIDNVIQMGEKWAKTLSHPLIAMAMNIVIFAIMGAICGAVAAAVWKKKAAPEVTTLES
jgi:hypothetical protein